MESAEQFLRLFSYDDWANEQVLITLQDHANFKDSAKAIGSFAHIAGAQELWYCRIEGQSPNGLQVWPDYELSEAFQTLKTYSEKWQELIETNRDDPDRMISYENSKGDPYETMLSDILHHVIIHGQHHRAQIAKFLRKANVTPPATDFIFFSRFN